MSDAQLAKLKEDRESLSREVALLNAAVKPEEAAEAIIAQLRRAEVDAAAQRTPHLTATALAQRSCSPSPPSHPSSVRVWVDVQDPFCLPSENDWNTASDQGACSCVIS